MKYKKAMQILVARNKVNYRTLDNIVFSFYSPEKQLKHLFRIKSYLEIYNDNEMAEFWGYLEKNQGLKNCLDGHEVPIRQVWNKQINSIHYGCYVIDGHIYVRNLVAWLKKKGCIADVIASYKYIVKLI